MITNTLCCHGAFRCRRKHFPLSFMRLQWLPLYPRHPPFHDEAGLSLLSVLLLHFCLTSLKVNLFSSLRSLSTSRIIFCVSWQFCVCRVMSVCFGIGAAIEHIRDIYIILRSISSEYFDSLSCMCLCFFSFFNQLLTSCLHPRWIRQSTNSCPTLQPPCIHQREVRLHIQVFILKPSTCWVTLQFMVRAQYSSVRRFTGEYFAQVCLLWFFLFCVNIMLCAFVFLFICLCVCVCVCVCVSVHDPSVSFVSQRTASPSNQRPYRSSSNRRSIAGFPDETSKAKTPTVSSLIHTHTHTCTHTHTRTHTCTPTAACS